MLGRPGAKPSAQERGTDRATETGCALDDAREQGEARHRYGARRRSAERVTALGVRGRTRGSTTRNGSRDRGWLSVGRRARAERSAPPERSEATQRRVSDGVGGPGAKPPDQYGCGGRI